MSLLLAGLLAVLALTSAACAPVADRSSRPNGVTVSSPPRLPDSVIASPATAAAAIGRLPLVFEPNVGQAPAGVRYVSRAGGSTLWLSSREARFGTRADDSIRLRWPGGATAPTVTAADELPGKAHYYDSPDPGRWRRDVPMYRRVVYGGVYRGIDLVFHGSQRQTEFDFVVAPGADPRAVRLEVAGADTVTLEGDDLVATRGSTRLVLHAPDVYQHTAAGRTSVPGRFRLAGRRLAFEVGDYDRTRPLVIDPVVTYSTYLGGSGSESGYGIGVDSAGNIYVALGDAGGHKIVKLSPDGQSLLYSTSTGDASPKALAVDAAGNAYVLTQCPYNRSGITFSCPVLNGLATGQPTAQGDEGAYVTKLNPSGVIVFSTSMGGSGSAVPGSIAVDAAGNIYATAWNVYGNFPLTRPAFSTPAGAGGFHTVVEAIAADTSRFLYVDEFQTGNSFFSPPAIAVDRTGAVYLAGSIGASTMPTTPGAFQTTDAGHGGGVVAKIVPDGSALAYCTYFGSNPSATNSINPTGIAVDADGNAYIAGWATSALPTLNAIQPAPAGGADAFVARLNAAGSALIFSTYLGGSGDDAQNTAIALDSSANIYVAGRTNSSDFPQRNPLPTTLGSAASSFVAELTSDGQGLVYSTYFGHAGDSITALSATSTGTVYLTGFTTSTGFPTVQPYQATYGGNADAFVAILQPSEPRVFITSPAAGSTVTGSVWSDVWVENYVGSSNAFTLSIGSTVVATATATNHATMAWDSRAVPDGSQTLVATVKDSAGHVGTATRAFVVKNGVTSTLTATFTSPAAGATVSGPVTIGMSETGASGTPITFTLTIDGGQAFTTSGTATTASFSWDTTKVANGAHTLGLTVSDGTGHTATATRSVTVSNTTGGGGGTLRVALTSPSSGSTVSGTNWAVVWVSGASGTSNVYTLTVGTQTVGSTTTSSTGPVSIAWNTAAVPNGTQTLTASVRDATGNTGSASVSVNVQNAGGGTASLVASITSPANGATVSAMVAVNMSETGASGTPIGFTLQIDGTQVFTTSGTATTASFSWDTTKVADGSHTLTLTVTDGAGRSSTATATVTVANGTGGGATFNVFITAPSNGATVKGTVWFTVWIDDATAGSRTYTLSVGGTTITSTSTSSNGPVSLPWATTTADNGARTATVTVRDPANATGRASITLTVAN